MSADIKPTHKAIQKYRQMLADFQTGYVTHEGAVETAFQRLLADTARSRGWGLVPKQRLKVGGLLPVLWSPSEWGRGETGAPPS